jgi:hypothetical protein
MAKIESIGTSLLPVALVAGLLSTLLRPPVPPETHAKAASRTEHSRAIERDQPAGDPESLADVRPVLELLGDALNVDVRLDGTPRNDREALARLVAAATRAGTGSGPGDVAFLIATIPDYVDSNSDWMADQSLAAMQAAMSTADFALDRFRLIDWSHDEAAADAATSTGHTHLHERQPGALIFRQAQSSSSGLCLRVVLLVLESATAGVHKRAFTNAARLAAEWDEASGRPRGTLRIVGPTFSGSAVSIAMALRDLPADRFAGVRVVSGSATAQNVKRTIERTFAPDPELPSLPVTFEATVQSDCDVQKALATFLGELNPAWIDSRDVALLIESNTGYGQSVANANAKVNVDPHAANAGANGNASANRDVGANGGTSVPRDAGVVGDCVMDAGPAPAGQPFRDARVYRFPLHVAQLRSEAKTTQTFVSLLPAPSVSLDLREQKPPADQIPAFQPQLTSATVEAAVANIIDNMHHERISAVGIFATDERDVLFLARAIKREIPDMQLFFAGNHVLYLHPDFTPYTRGAIVASTYPISLGLQHRSSAHRGDHSFPGMGAEGVFNATLALLDVPSAAGGSKVLDYCSPADVFADATTPRPCTPPIWLSVVGDDAFWPVRWQDVTPSAAQPGAVIARQVMPLQHPTILPLPTPACLVITAVLLIVALHVGALLFARLSLVRVLTREGADQARRHLAGPLRAAFVRLLAPPLALPQAVRLHQFALCVCFMLLALITYWAMSVVVAQWTVDAPSGSFRSSSLGHLLATIISIAAALGVVLSCLVGQRRLRPLEPWRLLSGESDPLPEARVPRENAVISMLLLTLMAVTVVAFAGFVFETYSPQDAHRVRTALNLGRTAGGGAVSPASGALCLFAALYVPMIWSLRRLSLLGRGYTSMTGSYAFRLFAGPAESAESVAPAQATRADREPDEVQRFVAMLDMPMQNLPWPYLVVIAVVLIAGAGCLWHKGMALDGRAFSWFMFCGTGAALALGLMLVAQSAETWRLLHRKLGRLAHGPLAAALGRVGTLPLRWSLWLTPPSTCELLPATGLVDNLRGQTWRLARRSANMAGVRLTDQRQLPPDAAVSRLCEKTLAMRQGELHTAIECLAAYRGVRELDDISGRPKATTLLQSDDWFALCALADALARCLQGASWLRHPHKDGTRWLEQAESVIALQYALMIRDVLARIMSGLLAAMLCLTLVAAAHLFYMFQGRSSFLTLDLLAIGAAAIVAIWLLTGMERDGVLSRLRNTPGRINWEFIKRITLYGAFPLLTVVGSLFPEVGDFLFGWLEPLRKLATF